MVDSRVRIFKGFYQYLVTSYVDKHTDKALKQKLIQAITFNSIETNGDFIVKKLKYR